MSIDWLQILLTIVGAAVSSASTIAVMHWRLKDAEDRLAKLDRDEPTVFTRLTRLEARRGH